MKKTILLLLCQALSYSLMADVFCQKLLIVDLDGKAEYGDVSFDDKGAITLLNSKTEEDAAKTFWTSVVVKFDIANRLRKEFPKQFKLDEIGFYFPSNKGIVSMSLTESKVTWKDFNPTEKDKLFWDQVKLTYDPAMETKP